MAARVMFGLPAAMLLHHLKLKLTCKCKPVCYISGTSMQCPVNANPLIYCLFLACVHF